MDTEKEQSEPKSSGIKNKAKIAGFFHRSLESNIEFEEKWAEGLAKFLTKSFGTLSFLNLVLFVSVFWIVVNLGLIPAIDPFDPYPFNWIMVIVQFFGIVLSVVVLMNQNRESRINEVYQKMEFEINVRAEHEITKTLQMIEEIHTKLGIAKADPELEQMKEKIDITEIKEDVEQAIEETSNKTGVA
ncbi:MAG: DUF1003 domain-containing protein [bacterium]|nr:DUF1003 domain-containing protein [bacterium]